MAGKLTCFIVISLKVKNDHRSEFSNLSNCDDHSSLSSITTVQNELFHIFHISGKVVRLKM